LLLMPTSPLIRLSRAVVFTAGLAAAFPNPLPAAEAELRFQSGPRQTALVELYTSEGCSSCPPAEAWLNRLGSVAGLWTEFVPVALHVAYWDHLGWRDPWAASEFTARQRTYARAWASDTVYTPGLVLNGTEWRAWARHTSVPPQTETTGVLTAHSTDGVRWQIEFTPATPRGAVEVSLALLARGLESDVRAGENRGRRLRHDFVALGLATYSMQRVGTAYRADVPLPPVRTGASGDRALAVWVATAGQLAPVQALGGDLPRAKP
jgi:hypothetical protein